MRVKNVSLCLTLIFAIGLVVFIPTSAADFNPNTVAGPVAGEERWSEDLPMGVKGDPALGPNGEYMYVPTQKNGILVYRMDDGFEPSARSPKGTVPASSGVKHKPVINNDVIYFAQGNTLKAYNLDDRSKQWEFQTKDPIEVQPLIDGNYIYIADRRGTLYKVKIDSVSSHTSLTGNMWKTDPSQIDGGFLYTDVHSTGGNIIVGTGLGSGGNLYSIDKSSGSTNWDKSITTPVHSIDINDNVVYVGDEDGAVSAHAASTGNVKFVETPFSGCTTGTCSIDSLNVVDNLSRIKTNNFEFMVVGARSYGIFRIEKSSLGSATSRKFGSSIWTKNVGAPTTGHTISDSDLYVTTNNGYVYSHDMSLGDINRGYPHFLNGQLSVNSPVINSDGIVGLAADGIRGANSEVSTVVGNVPSGIYYDDKKLHTNTLENTGVNALDIVPPEKRRAEMIDISRGFGIFSPIAEQTNVTVDQWNRNQGPEDNRAISFSIDVDGTAPIAFELDNVPENSRSPPILYKNGKSITAVDTASQLSNHRVFNQFPNFESSFHTGRGNDRFTSGRLSSFGTTSQGISGYNVFSLKYPAGTPICSGTEYDVDSQGNLVNITDPDDFAQCIEDGESFRNIGFNHSSDRNIDVNVTFNGTDQFFNNTTFEFDNDTFIDYENITDEFDLTESDINFTINNSFTRVDLREYVYLNNTEASAPSEQPDLLNETTLGINSSVYVDITPDNFTNVDINSSSGIGDDNGTFAYGRELNLDYIDGNTTGNVTVESLNSFNHTLPDVNNFNLINATITGTEVIGTDGSLNNVSFDPELNLTGSISWKQDVLFKNSTNSTGIANATEVSISLDTINSTPQNIDPKITDILDRNNTPADGYDLQNYSMDVGLLGSNGSVLTNVTVNDTIRTNGTNITVINGTVYTNSTNVRNISHMEILDSYAFGVNVSTDYPDIDFDLPDDFINDTVIYENESISTILRGGNTTVSWNQDVLYQNTTPAGIANQTGTEDNESFSVTFENTTLIGSLEFEINQSVVNEPGARIPLPSRYYDLHSYGVDVTAWRFANKTDKIGTKTVYETVRTIGFSPNTGSNRWYNIENIDYMEILDVYNVTNTTRTPLDTEPRVANVSIDLGDRFNVTSTTFTTRNSTVLRPFQPGLNESIIVNGSEIVLENNYVELPGQSFNFTDLILPEGETELPNRTVTLPDGRSINLDRDTVVIPDSVVNFSDLNLNESIDMPSDVSLDGELAFPESVVENSTINGSDLEFGLGTDLPDRNVTLPDGRLINLDDDAIVIPEPAFNLPGLNRSSAIDVPDNVDVPAGGFVLPKNSLSNFSLTLNDIKYDQGKVSMPDRSVTLPDGRSINLKDDTLVLPESSVFLPGITKDLAIQTPDDADIPDDSLVFPEDEVLFKLGIGRLPSLPQGDITLPDKNVTLPNGREVNLRDDLIVLPRSALAIGGISENDSVDISDEVDLPDGTLAFPQEALKGSSKLPYPLPGQTIETNIPGVVITHDGVEVKEGYVVSENGTVNLPGIDGSFTSINNVLYMNVPTTFGEFGDILEKGSVPDNATVVGGVGVSPEVETTIKVTSLDRSKSNNFGATVIEFEIDNDIGSYSVSISDLSENRNYDIFSDGENIETINSGGDSTIVIEGSGNVDTSYTVVSGEVQSGDVVTGGGGDEDDGIKIGLSGATPPSGILIGVGIVLLLLGVGSLYYYRNQDDIDFLDDF